MLINDLKPRVLRQRLLIDAAVARVFDRAWMVAGPEVKDFGAAFASYIGTAFCRGVANGTDALELALKALDVGENTPVATVANAGFYTSTALQAVGASPHYMDVETSHHLTTLAEVKRAVGAGVRVVVVTHLYGQAIPEIEEIAALCKQAKVGLIEDCAQAHGARVKGRRVGSFGDLGCFSFYPTKNLGALGDGGAVVTSRPELAERIERLSQYGWTTKYQVSHAGARNSRLDELQAAILLVFLPELDACNERRRTIANRYSEAIRHRDVQVPSQCGDESVAHLYVVRVNGRDALRDHLKSFGISTDIHYPIPDHRQPVFAGKFAQIQLPNTEQLATEIMTLPLYPEMSDSQVDEVIVAVNQW